jgi:membrane protein implicated in regulation of membrane protease activity
MVKLLVGAGAVALALLIWLPWEPLASDLANWLLEKVGLLGRKGEVPGLRSRSAIVKSSFVADPSASEAIGTVEIKGELWNARCPATQATVLVVGDKVVVESLDGLTVRVRAA